MRGQSLAMVWLYTRIYEFKPLSEEVKTLRLGAAGALLSCVMCYRGSEPLCGSGGVAYIESTGPS